jgi:rod shape-determining protein MreC
VFVCVAIAVIIAVAGRTHASLFDRARASVSDATGPALSAVRVPLTAAQNMIAGIAGIFTVYGENAELRRENAELHKWQQVALSLEDRLRGYEKLLKAAPETRAEFITAHVIGESSRPFVKTMILDAGSANGVAKGQAVVNELGLLGRVYVTGEHTSWVIPVTDLNSRVPVTVEPSHRRAILVGDNSPAPQLELDVGDGPVRPGDRVVTTGDGGLLPPGVAIGVVTGQEGGARVQLLATPGEADAVNVLNYQLPNPPGSADPVPATENNRASATASLDPARNPAPPAPRIAPVAPEPADIPEELDR